ncbi:MAG: peptide chain release factor N(5)-glutamine methyltransferase [bacterium]
MNVQQALDSAAELFEQKSVESARLSAELIVAHVIHHTRAHVLANPERPLSKEEERDYQVCVTRRAKCEPIPYITGHVEFHSHEFKVVKGVFIPRPETEVLVDKALEGALRFEVPKILDVGTGCGNIFISMAHNLEDGEFHGTDISNTAIQCSQKNVRDHELTNYATLHEGNLFQALRGSLIKNFDVIVSNPPYIKTADIATLPTEIKSFEPHICLDGGREGLNFYRSFLDNVAPLLSPGGMVCLEIDPSLTEPLSDLVKRKKVFSAPEVTKDLSGNDRVLSFGFK